MKAKELAKYIINLGIQEQRPVSNLALQKILYFVDVAHINETGEKFLEEDFEAWAHGPVIREVYSEYKANGSRKIKTKVDHSINENSIPNNLRECIIKNLELDPWDLVDKSHAKGHAWDKVYNESESSFITIDLINKYEINKNI